MLAWVSAAGREAKHAVPIVAKDCDSECRARAGGIDADRMSSHQIECAPMYIMLTPMPAKCGRRRLSSGGRFRYFHRFNRLSVHECPAFPDLDEHRPEPAFPHPAHRAFRCKWQVGLGVGAPTHEDFWQKRCIHGNCGLGGQRIEPATCVIGVRQGQSQVQMRRSQAGARLGLGW